jgi:hypothetical protein
MLLKCQIHRQTPERASWEALVEATIFEPYEELRKKEFPAVVFWHDLMLPQIEAILSNRGDLPKIRGQQPRFIQEFLIGLKHFTAHPTFLSMSQVQGTFRGWAHSSVLKRSPDSGQPRLLEAGGTSTPSTTSTDSDSNLEPNYYEHRSNAVQPLPIVNVKDVVDLHLRAHGGGRDTGNHAGDQNGAAEHVP